MYIGLIGHTTCALPDIGLARALKLFSGKEIFLQPFFNSGLSGSIVSVLSRIPENYQPHEKN